MLQRLIRSWRRPESRDPVDFDAPDVDNNEIGSKRFGFGADLTTVRFYGLIGEILTNIEDINELSLTSDSTFSADQASDVVSLLGSIAALEAEGLGFAVNAAAGSVRIGRIGVGARIWGDAAAASSPMSTW